METLEELKEIIDSAPLFATLIDSGEYFKFESDEYYRWALICDIQGWYIDLEPTCDVRSLSDIKRIIELEEKLEAFADDISDCKCLGGVAKTLREYAL